MGPIWGREDPGGPHVGPMNFAIWVAYSESELVAYSVSIPDKLEHIEKILMLLSNFSGAILI